MQRGSKNFRPARSRRNSGSAEYAKELSVGDGCPARVDRPNENGMVPFVVRA
jgi:hypothetical protein